MQTIDRRSGRPRPGTGFAALGAALLYLAAGAPTAVLAQGAAADATEAVRTLAPLPAGAEAVDWDDPRWRFEAASAERAMHMGRPALELTRGTAWLDGVSLEDGEIEFDMAVAPEQGFHGVRFRAVDGSNHEYIYLRPHMSGQPDATQYTPIFNGLSGWQIYADPRFAQPLDIPADRWVRVRVSFRGGRARLAVEGESVTYPLLLREPTSGAIGLTSGGPTARFADVRISATPPAIEAGDAAEPEPLAPGLVRRWRVSTPFAEARVAGTAALDPSDWRELGWTPLEVGPRGIADLARVRTRSQEANTAFAAVTLRAERAGPAVVRLGFSDRVTAYLNGTPVFRGGDGYRTRDYRFLGTVGLFDELVLPLRQGDNELWLAVSEDFGGWAAVLDVPAGQGVTVPQPGGR